MDDLIGSNIRKAYQKEQLELRDTKLNHFHSNLMCQRETEFSGMTKFVSDFTFRKATNLLDILEFRPTTSFKRLFSSTIRNGFQQDFNLEKRVTLTVLVSGMIIHARKMFNHVLPTADFVSWIAMVTALVELGNQFDSCRMYQKWGIPDWGGLTFATMIRAATWFQLLFAGRQLHSLAMKMGFDKDNFVSAALIAMYTKSGSFQDAQTFFYDMPHQNIAGWNYMIAAYSSRGYDEEALSLFYEMHESGVPTDHKTFSIITEIYVKLGYLERAHANTTLLGCYRDWVKTRDAGFAVCSIYEKKPLETWNALLAGHARHGHDYEKTSELFQEMLDEGVRPNHATFHAVLTACSKWGWESIDGVWESAYHGWEYFKSMSRDHEMEPDATHFACMIDILGRENLLNEAFELLCAAPVEPTVDMWAALLTACRPAQHLELAKLASEELYAMEPEKLSSYILLLNIYKSSGMLKEARGVLDTLEKKGLRMVSPSSSIEINKISHVFFSNDKSHPQTEDIYKKVDELMAEVSRLGHIDGNVIFLPDVDENEQRIQKMYHSERLAIALGLVNTTDRRKSLRIVQDHRICEDCHNAVRLFALAKGRKIVVKDAGRFHHFENGRCSCGDYW
ncbi:hypothetical protein ACFE04_003930 [Oxalis oulophora]